MANVSIVSVESRNETEILNQTRQKEYKSMDLSLNARESPTLPFVKMNASPNDVGKGKILPAAKFLKKGAQSFDGDSLNAGKFLKKNAQPHDGYESDAYNSRYHTLPPEVKELNTRANSHSFLTNAVSPRKSEPSISTVNNKMSRSTSVDIKKKMENVQKSVVSIHPKTVRTKDSSPYSSHTHPKRSSTSSCIVS